MPRSIQDILDHADELAKRFEDYEPSEGDQVPVEEYLLRRAALTRARSEREVVDAGCLPEGPFELGITAGASTPNNKIGEALLRVLGIRGITPDLVGRETVPA